MQGATLLSFQSADPSRFEIIQRLGLFKIHRQLVKNVVNERLMGNQYCFKYRESLHIIDVLRAQDFEPLFAFVPPNTRHLDILPHSPLLATVFE